MYFKWQVCITNIHCVYIKVPMVYNAEEMIGDNEQMVAIGMVEEDGDEGEQVGKTEQNLKILTL